MSEATVVVPMFNAARWLPQVLAPLQALEWDIILVDDGSTDGTADVARQCLPRARVLCRPTRQGAWAARNDGVAAATSPVVVFLDADVVATASTLQRLVDYLRRRTEVAAVFGSYDDRPASTVPLSRFRNLLHHYVHQRGTGPVASFWAGCGAIRTDTLIACGGFAPFPIEDVELGARLSRDGHVIHLDATIQVTHLKQWTWASMLYTDVVVRGAPWTELALRHPHLRDSLVASPAYRWPPLLLLLGLSLWARPTAAAAVALLYLACNLPIYRFMGARGGLAFGLRSVLYLGVFHLSCLCGAALGTWRYLRRG